MTLTRLALSALAVFAFRRGLINSKGPSVNRLFISQRTPTAARA